MIISRAPLKVSLLGGGTDLKSFYKFYDGNVLTLTINKYVNLIYLDNPEFFDEKENDIVDALNESDDEKEVYNETNDNEQINNNIIEDININHNKEWFKNKNIEKFNNEFYSYQ